MPEDKMPRARRTKTAQKDHRIPWQTEHVRVTAFPISGATILPNSWKEITGKDPDEIVKQPPPMQSFEAGPFCRRPVVGWPSARSHRSDINASAPASAPASASANARSE
jgi:hypothetical protein